MSKSILSHQNFGGVSRITNLPAPSDTTEPVRLAELNAAIEGLKQKDPVVAATQGNINLSAPGATVDGITLTANDRVLVKAQTTDSENGIYIWAGAAVAMSRAADASTAAELTSALVPVSGGTNAGTNWRQTAAVSTIGSDSVTWILFGTSVAAATTSSLGTVQIASQAELDAGTDTSKVPTPATLGLWTGKKYKYSATVGDGSATQFDLTHNFGTRSNVVNIVRNSTPWDNVECDVSRPDVNTVRLTFASAPTADQFTAVVVA